MTTQAVGAKSSNSSDVYTFRASLTAPLKRIVHCALIRASLTSPLKRMVQQALIPLMVRHLEHVYCLTEPLKQKVHCALIRASLTASLNRMVQQALIHLMQSEAPLESIYF